MLLLPHFGCPVGYLVRQDCTDHPALTELQCEEAVEARLCEQAVSYTEGYAQ